MKLSIPDLVWNCQPWDGRGIWSEHTDIDEALHAAVHQKIGRGGRFIVECDKEQAEYLVKHIENLGFAWSGDAVDVEDRPKSRAMIEWSTKAKKLLKDTSE